MTESSWAFVDEAGVTEGNYVDTAPADSEAASVSSVTVGQTPE